MLTSLVLLAAITAETPVTPVPVPVPVKVERAASGWRLLRGGVPYRVRGVGGTARMELAARSGANSVRTWGADRLGQDLDLAHRQGMTVCAGIWLQHKSGLDYGNRTQVEAQANAARKVIEVHKDHPALLVWGLGNEMEHTNDTPELWKAVNELALMVKRTDQSHPTMTVVAEISPLKISNIKRYAPDIDILGINSYGGVPSLGKRLAEFGWDKPYMVTEFGPLGPWEMGKTPWGAALEQNSTEKAAFFKKSYEAILADAQRCLGSYAFLWGEKQETTPTWFGMFLDSGEALESVDLMTSLWTGKPVANAPQIREFRSDASGKEVAPGADLGAVVNAKDPNGDGLTFRWVLRREVTDTRFAGEGEQRPSAVAQFDTGSKGELRLQAPAGLGPYRLYLYVTDGSGRAATANFPFLVKSPER